MADPYFSICVPQYSRTSFLMQACAQLAEQSWKDFEICISDDCSPDHRQSELQTFLKKLGLRYVFQQQQKNLRYDGNLRAALSLASGKFCLLMGNDDQLAHAHVLRNLHRALEEHPNTGVAITNYAEYSGERAYRRVSGSGCRGTGPQLAVSRLRNFSFVSGVILRRDRAKEHFTTKWDGSEMYQMYLGCRIIAEGYDLLEIEEIAVLKNLTLEGESVNSYAMTPKLEPCPLQERKLPLGQMGALVFDAVRPFGGRSVSTLGTRIFLQILLFTYPFWIIEYRRVQSWKYAAGICLGMRPRNLLDGTALPALNRLFLKTVYLAVTLTGLMIPISLFEACQLRLYAFAKSQFQRG